MSSILTRAQGLMDIENESFPKKVAIKQSKALPGLEPGFWELTLNQDPGFREETLNQNPK